MWNDSEDENDEKLRAVETTGDDTTQDAVEDSQAQNNDENSDKTVAPDTNTTHNAVEEFAPKSPEKAAKSDMHKSCKKRDSIDFDPNVVGGQEDSPTCASLRALTGTFRLDLTPDNRTSKYILGRGRNFSDLQTRTIDNIFERCKGKSQEEVIAHIKRFYPTLPQAIPLPTKVGSQKAFTLQYNWENNNWELTRIGTNPIEISSVDRTEKHLELQTDTPHALQHNDIISIVILVRPTEPVYYPLIYQIDELLKKAKH